MPHADVFADRLVAAIRMHGPLCVGIDPHPGQIPDVFDGDTPTGMRKWALSAAETVLPLCRIIKPQVALFERHGPAGMAALADLIAHARKLGHIVIADAKRGDIGSTAEGYARAWLAPGAPFESDAVTVNPYMGLDTLEPFLDVAETHGKGVAVLVRTSNPGAADFQSRLVEGAPLYERVAEALAPAIARLKGRSGWSGLMMVVGATAPDEARALRRLAPNALFLVPGYGTQGGSAADALSGFVPGPDGLEGGIINASRSVTMPPGSQSASTFEKWQEMIQIAATQAQSDLRAASTSS